MRSGIPNFCAVALALSDLGYVRKYFMLLLSLDYKFYTSMKLFVVNVPSWFLVGRDTICFFK